VVVVMLLIQTMNLIIMRMMMIMHFALRKYLLTVVSLYLNFEISKLFKNANVNKIFLLDGFVS